LRAKRDASSTGEALDQLGVETAEWPDWLNVRDGWSIVVEYLALEDEDAVGGAP
jgi:hypothetical protein